MPKHKKLWKKPKVIIIDIGKCKYCKEDMTNQESFVAFYPKGKAHYKCMREDDRKNNYMPNNFFNQFIPLFFILTIFGFVIQIS